MPAFVSARSSDESIVWLMVEGGSRDDRPRLHGSENIEQARGGKPQDSGDGMMGCHNIKDPGRRSRVDVSIEEEKSSQS